MEDAIIWFIMFVLLPVGAYVTYKVIRTSNKKRFTPTVTKRIAPHAFRNTYNLKALGDIEGRKTVYVCPQCFLVSATLQTCPNHGLDKPTMRKGSSDQFDYYRKMQETLQTEDPK